jgi:tetratricopeptide (TPR) repeat protein
MNSINYHLREQAKALTKAGKHKQAADLYRKLLDEAPEDLIGLINLGTYLIQSGDVLQGLSLIEKATVISPKNVNALNTQANALKALKRYQEALDVYDLALQLKPDFASAWANRGNVLRDFTRFDEALQSYNQALVLVPDDVHFLNLRGMLYKNLHRLDEALSDFKRALQIEFNSDVTHFNIANCYVQIDDVNLALQHFSHAIEINPKYAEAYNNRSNLLKSLNRLDAALQDADRAIKIRPNYIEANWNRALIYLLMGDYLNGWNAYEWRWKRSDRNFHQHYQKLPRWVNQQDIAGKNIVLHAEQGFGDTIQFCRYAPIIAGLGANVYLDVPPALRSLLKSLGSNIHVVDSQIKNLKVDLHTPLMSLPWIFKHTLQDIPAPNSYLFASDLDIDMWTKKLGMKTRKRIGISWAGNPSHTNDKRRSIALSKLKPILELDFEFHSLQKDVSEADHDFLTELSASSCMQHDFNSFADTAALMSAMDLVITIDSAVAHLSGALGCPTWLMLPYAPDFRWMLARDDSPWYPSMRLFRQDQVDEWHSVVLKVCKELSSIV